jgi:hypothetical protein
MDLFDYAEGVRRRDRGLCAVEHSNPAYLQQARDAARAIALRMGRVSINEVRAAVGPPPDGTSPNIMGAVFRTSDWQIVGYTQTRHAAGHARRVCIYALI